MFCFVFLCIVFKFFSQSRSNRHRNLPPSPPALPIIGHLHLIKSPVHRTLHSISQTLGPVFSLRFGSRLVVVVSSPSVIEECFTKNDTVLANRPRLIAGKYIGYNYTNVVTAPYGDHWRNLRRLMAVDIFSAARLNVSAAVRRDEINLLLNSLYKKSSNDFARVDLKSKFSGLSFNIITRIIAGKRYYGEELASSEEAGEFQELVRETFEQGGTSNPNDYLPILQWIDYGGYEKNLRRIHGKMDAILQGLINEHKGDKSGNNSMIDHLLSLQESEPEYYTDAIIRGLILFMSHNPDVVNSGNLDSLPSWISDHLGEGSSYMTDEVNQSSASPMEGSPSLETNPLVAIHSSVEEKNNIMTLEEPNSLRESYSFPPGVQARLPEEGETIVSARQGEVAFYEATFPAGLRFSIHPTIRNLFSLNSNPKPDQGWLYFKARYKKTLLGGYPSNVKGWKSKFFFVSGDEWEFPEGSPREGAPRVPRTRGVLALQQPSSAIRRQAKSFRGDLQVGGEDGAFFRASAPGLEVISLSFYFSGVHGVEDCGRGTSRRWSAELVGQHRTELRKIFPHIPDLTLLRWSGKKVLDLILNRYMNAPSSGSDPTSKSCSDSSLSIELESDAMSKRISFKKLDEKLKKSKNGSSGTHAPAKRVVIGEKRTGEGLANSPSKKGKVDDVRRGKGLIASPKATSSSNASTTPTTTSSRPEEGIGVRLLFGCSEKGGGGARLFPRRARVREQQANDELAKMKSDRDSFANKFERLGILIVELRKALGKAKESAVEEFKSSLEFVVAVEDSTSKYFGEGFDFCKVQFC
ncbi:cytochrome P450, family 81, subfamily H, polypeptide 1 [Actinidia rufa]|uniref:Cytochrome P450, family 81, subfamily H, polypeptide 1 n=1 Tax=Actinidia rufa TaxID=165716 RepID=A0A7J0F5T3_9ERIC|nr:cytochrome P450, family 81, subfamily H, polypeptide 1 [Actinidia rufa]